MNMRVAGVELGGTKCVAILGSGFDAIDEMVEVRTTTPDATLGQLRETLDRWHAGAGFAALGIASFGPLDLSAGTVAATPKPGWAGARVFATLTEGYGVPAAFDTDVTGAALAEGRWGSAIGLPSYCYVTVGTGIGAGVIVNGRPAGGMDRAEAGHIRMARVAGDDWAGSCPFHGDCVEGLASGSAIAARIGRPAGSLAPDDPAWELAADALAQLLHALALIAVPQKIILGGGVINAQPHLLPRIRHRLGASLAGYCAPFDAVAAREDRVCTSALGNKVGPLGALALAISSLAK